MGLPPQVALHPLNSPRVAGGSKTVRISPPRFSGLLGLTLTVLGLLPGCSSGGHDSPAGSTNPAPTGSDSDDRPPETDSTAPLLTEISATSAQGRAATVLWKTSEVATGWVDFGLTPAYGTRVLAPTPGTQHAVALVGLIPGSEYHFRVVGSDEFGNLSSSGDLTFQSNDDTPPVISHLTSEVLGGDSARITWDTDEPTTGRVSYGLATPTEFFELSGPPLLTSHSVLLTGLQPGGAYSFTVTATDVFGNVFRSSLQMFTTDDLTDPVITNIQVLTGPGTDVTLAFDTDEDTTADVDYGTTSAYGDQVSILTPDSSHTALLTPLPVDTEMHYRITVYDAFGNTSDTGDLTFQTNDLTAPQITNVQVTAITTDSATISWTTDEPSLGEVDHGPTAAYGSTVPSGPPPATSHAVTLTGLVPDSTVHYRITARDSFDNASSTADQTFDTEEPPGVEITGSLVAWQPLEVSFQGPMATELDSAPNPFLDYRLTVDFSGPSGQSYSVPGFFDGNGSGSGTGSVWSVRFAPDEAGIWNYTAHFDQGTEVALDLDPMAGTPTSFDGTVGQVTIAALDPTAPGFYKWGRLEYTGEHYLKFRDGPYFLKTASNSPENFLAYKGFDNTVDQGGIDTTGLENGLHRFLPHEADWGPTGLGDADDPLFTSADTGSDSKGIIGALNYLASEEVNGIYFLPMNLGGDGQEVAPFVGYSGSSFDKTHYDVSKLHQWNQFFEHATKRGLSLHFVLAEREVDNRNYLDSGTLGVERKLYYRELIARFGHALAIKWTLSEENLYSVPSLNAFADYIQAVDPYDHPIAIHTPVLPLAGDYAVYTAVLGDARFSAASIQTSASNAGSHTERWRTDSATSGQKWVVEIDELTLDATDMNADTLRECALYDVLFSGGTIEWYMGYHPLPLGGDLRCEDFRTRADIWEYSRYARRFMEDHLPFWEMEPADSLVSGAASHFDGSLPEVFAKADDTYAIYLPVSVGTATLDLTGATGTFQQRWYNPRTGLFEGSPQSVSGGSVVSLGSAPSGPAGEDWVVLFER